MAEVKITCRSNGSYRIEGDISSITLVDVDGNNIDLTGKAAFSLCRCGASSKKPFCDGTHSKIGFQAAEPFVRVEQPKPIVSNPEGGNPAKG